MTNQRMSPSDLEQVRAILFGEQVRESEKRLGQIEEELAAEVEAVRDELSKRVDALDALVKKQNEAQTKRLRDASARHGESEKGLARRIAELAKELRAESTARSAELSAEIEAEIEALQIDKVGKEELSTFFADVALRLVDRKQIRRS